MAFLQAFLEERRKKELKQKLNSTTDYKFIKALGQGAFGDACLLQNTKDGNKYVAKAMQITDGDIHDLAEREMETLKHLDHPNIVKYVDCSYDKNKKYIFIIMEFCAGGDLFDYMTNKKKKKDRIEEVDVWNWTLQIFSALKGPFLASIFSSRDDIRDFYGERQQSVLIFISAVIHYMHGKQPKVLHRDLKPANIFLTDDRANVKLGDFGVSRSLASTMDMATTLCGTPQYLSPELLIEQPYNHKADVWAAGCCVYELMALEHATKVNWVVRSVKVNPMPTGYDKELVSIVEEMLSIDPNKRPDISDILKRPYVSSKRHSLQKVLSYSASGQVTAPHPSNGKRYSNSVFYNDNGNDDDDDNEVNKTVHSNNYVDIATIKIDDDKEEKTTMAAVKPRAQEPPRDSSYLAPIEARANEPIFDNKRVHFNCQISDKQQAEAAKYQEQLDDTYMAPRQRPIAALNPSRASETIYDIEKYLHDEDAADADHTYEFIDDMNGTLTPRPPSSSTARYLPIESEKSRGDVRRMNPDKESTPNHQIERLKTCSEDIRNTDPYEKLESLGYKFNTAGELRYIKDGSRYDHSRDGFKYEEICEAVHIYLSHIFVNKYGMLKIVLPVDAVENEPASFAYISRDALENTEKLMILVQGSGSVVSGEWSRKLIVNESIDAGSQAPWHLAAQRKGYAVIMANLNYNTVEVEGVKYPIRQNEDKDRHMQCIWNLVSRGCQAKKIVFVAHSTGGNALLRMAASNQSVLEKIFCVVFADSMHEHSSAAKDVSDDLRIFLKEHSRNYIPHDSKEVGNLLKKASRKRLSPTYSAGNVEHAETCNNIIASAMEFIENEFHKYKNNSADDSLLTKAKKLVGMS